MWYRLFERGWKSGCSFSSGAAEGDQPPAYVGDRGDRDVAGGLPRDQGAQGRALVKVGEAGAAVAAGELTGLSSCLCATIDSRITVAKSSISIRGCSGLIID